MISDCAGSLMVPTNSRGAARSTMETKLGAPIRHIGAFGVARIRGIILAVADGLHASGLDSELDQSGSQGLRPRFAQVAVVLRGPDHVGVPGENQLGRIPPQVGGHLLHLGELRVGDLILIEPEVDRREQIPFYVGTEEVYTIGPAWKRDISAVSAFAGAVVNVAILAGASFRIVIRTEAGTSLAIGATGEAEGEGRQKRCRVEKNEEDESSGFHGGYGGG